VTQKRKHSQEEISAKLAQAHELATQGRLQSEIAGILGVSVMTLHRWRKAFAKPALSAMTDTTGRFERELGAKAVGIPDLQLENSRLRRLVTDLLLERMKLVEEMQRNVLLMNVMKQSAP
jgi:putative transposase